LITNSRTVPGVQGRLATLDNWDGVPFHNRIIGYFMVYQDRLETNLLQLFPHPENSELFSIICAIIFEVNIVAAQKQA